MNIPLEFRDKTFEGYRGKERIVAEIKALAEARKWTGISSSVTGIGKTHLACAAMELSWQNDLRHINDDGSVEMWVGDDWMRISDPSYNDLRYSRKKYLFVPVWLIGHKLAMAGIELPKILEDLMSYRCLLLDDLGKEPDKAITLVETLIMNAYDAWKQIIFTTSLSKDGLSDRYDGAVLRRILDKGEIVNLGNKTE